MDMHASKSKEDRDFIKAALFVLFLVLLLIITIFINPNNEDSKEEAHKAKVKCLWMERPSYAAPLHLNIV